MWHTFRTIRIHVLLLMIDRCIGYINIIIIMSSLLLSNPKFLAMFFNAVLCAQTELQTEFPELNNKEWLDNDSMTSINIIFCDTVFSALILFSFSRMLHQN